MEQNAAVNSINYKGTIENSPNGVIYTDEVLVVNHINPAAENLLGIRHEEAVGKEFAQLMPQARITPETLDEEKIYRCKCGEYELGIRLFRIADREGTGAEAGQKDGYVIVLHDFYDEISMAARLDQMSQTLEEWRQLIEFSFDGFLVTDGECNVLLYNQAYVKNTGITPEYLDGKNLKDLINPVWMKTSVAVLVKEKRQSVSMHHATQNNKNIIVTGTPIFDPDGAIKWIIINTRDMSEIYALREELLRAREMENEYFQKLAQINSGELPEEMQDIVVTDGRMQEIYCLAKRLANFDATVLITGESGVGKEVVARYIHENSLRSQGKFVAVNCGAIPENLLESELFGYLEGAFTGAVKGGRAGLFEAAHGGTLFLDEIGEMSLNLQVKLLRVLETHMISRVGATDQISVDIRIIAATNRNLQEMIQNGQFRDDLYYRLNVVCIEIPALRDRVDDVGPLVMKFLHRFNKQYGQEKKMTFEVLREMENYNWPGNIRQLKNVVENMVVVSNNDYLQLNDLPWVTAAAEPERKGGGEFPTLKEATESMERSLLTRAREKYGSTRKIAEMLEVDQSTIVRKLKKYGL